MASKMKIAFYAPFKPIDHPIPSGDLTIAKGIVKFLEDRGHKINVQSRLRARWLYYTPWKWPLFIFDFIKILISLKMNPPNFWLTYHTYYKAPDILGPWICRILNIRYVIFQGIYSTKRRKKLKTVIGFYLNRAALQKADHVFTNKSIDFKNLKRLIADHQLTYIRPGIYPGNYEKREKQRQRLRNEWSIGSRSVILSAAMFRDDVKTRGLLWLIDCCAELIKKGIDFKLVIAGSGQMENKIKAAAKTKLTGHVRFVGKLAPKDMPGFYSAGDIFAFPGIGEALGMVFLEAQSCGLPVVAFDNGGIPEVVIREKTGFLTPMYDCPKLNEKMEILLSDKDLRMKMGQNASEYVRTYHDLDVNYQHLEDKLLRITGS